MPIYGLFLRGGGEGGWAVDYLSSHNFNKTFKFD